MESGWGRQGGRTEQHIQRGQSAATAIAQHLENRCEGTRAWGRECGLNGSMPYRRTAALRAPPREPTPEGGRPGGRPAASVSAPVPLDVEEAKGRVAGRAAPTTGAESVRR